MGDSAASTAGAIALAGSSVVSSTGAGVAGIVAYDGVVAAIRSGKTARGVSEHDKYQFGDIVSKRVVGDGAATKSIVISPFFIVSDLIPDSWLDASFGKRS